jgi:hypothetical protein
MPINRFLPAYRLRLVLEAVGQVSWLAGIRNSKNSNRAGFIQLTSFNFEETLPYVRIASQRLGPGTSVNPSADTACKHS